jgi:hypothetical protein
VFISTQYGEGTVERIHIMARRTGVPAMHRVAKRLCFLLFVFGPIIRRTYPGNAALLAALTAAEVACHGLGEELFAVLEFGD